MKRIRCPKCDEPITFDDALYSPGNTLVFECPECHKQFKVRIGADRRVGKPTAPGDYNATADHGADSTEEEEKTYGHLVVIENAFHYRQEIPLHEGENRIGRFVRGTAANAAIKTVDPSVDTTHCRINVSIGRDGEPRFVLSDGPSGTGTFLKNEILRPKDRVYIEDGAIITIGATTMILRTEEDEDD